MIIEFDESTPLHVIKELAPGLRLDDKTVELSIPDLDAPAEVVFNVDFGKDPVSFVRMSYNDQPLDPQQKGHGKFKFDPAEFGHTLKIEFKTDTIPMPKKQDAPQLILAAGDDEKKEKSDSQLILADDDKEKKSDSQLLLSEGDEEKKADKDQAG